MRLPHRGVVPRPARTIELLAPERVRVLAAVLLVLLLALRGRGVVRDALQAELAEAQRLAAAPAAVARAAVEHDAAASAVAAAVVEAATLRRAVVSLAVVSLAVVPAVARRAAVAAVRRPIPALVGRAARGGALALEPAAARRRVGSGPTGGHGRARAVLRGDADVRVRIGREVVIHGRPREIARRIGGIDGRDHTPSGGSTRGKTASEDDAERGDDVRRACAARVRRRRDRKWRGRRGGARARAGDRRQIGGRARRRRDPRNRRSERAEPPDPR